VDTLPSGEEIITEEKMIDSEIVTGVGKMHRFGALMKRSPCWTAGMPASGRLPVNLALDGKREPQTNIVDRKLNPPLSHWEG